ncbi:MAG TPA: FecR domain-containing protein, partial [Opitutaceae bacterium]|nr:FecR domain-containing protein [Opitutaceae bacterium]
MKKYIMFAAAVALSFAGRAQAQETATQATVTKVVGTASFTVAGGSAQTIAAGTKLPQGAEITTGDKSQVTVEAHEGIVAIAGSKTTFTVEKLSVSGNGTRNAVLALKSGNIASSLDPAKKSSNNYSVRTAKGTAAARGTTYSVAYDGVTYSVTVVAGVVQSFNASGAAVNVTAGQVSSNSGSGATMQTLAEAVASNPTMGDGLSLLASAVASVSTNLADVTAVIGTIASSAGTGQTATNVVASATAAAASTAATNSNLTSTGGGSTSVASTLVGAAVNASAAAGNAAA